MIANLSDVRSAVVAGGVRMLARTTPFVESELNGLRHVVHRGSVCLDIGAALGLYTVTLSRLVGPEGTVHSVEPLLFAHPALSYVLRPRHGRNIVRHCLALDDRIGQDVMSVPVRNGIPITGRSLLTHGINGLGSNDEFDEHLEVVVAKDTLDQFCADRAITRLDFIKADVEGAELRVLEGGAETLARLRPTLLLEIEDRHTTRYGHKSGDITAWLTDRGYRMSVWERGQWRLTEDITLAHRNYLFTPTPSA